MNEPRFNDLFNLGPEESAFRSLLHPSGCGKASCTGMAGPQTRSPPVGPASCDLVPAARQGIVLLDECRRILSLNAAARHVFGCAEEDLSGRPVESLLGAPQRTVLDRDDRSGKDAADPHWPPSANGCMGRRADGSNFPMDIEIARIASAQDDGSRACFAAFIWDLSVESDLRAELRSVERHLHTLVELAPIAIWVAEDDHVTFANRAAGNLMGVVSGAALVGQSIYSLLSIDDHAAFRRQLAHALSHEGKLGSLQAHLRRNNSEVREVEIALAVLPDHGRTTVQMMVSDVSQRNRELREVERSRQLFRRLSANVVEAREAERRRIARELHDELGQSLSALKMDIADCARSGGFPAGNDRASALLAHLDDIMKSVRRIAADLRPLMLDDLGLSDAIESLANDFSRRLGVRVHLHMDPVEPPANEKVSIAIYRIVQEALTNVARHSQATEAHIDLRRHDGELVLSVRDDGVGLPSPSPPQRESQFGLLGMQERADALGGRLELENQPDGGARVIMHMPIGAPDARPEAWSARPAGHGHVHH